MHTSVCPGKIVAAETGECCYILQRVWLFTVFFLIFKSDPSCLATGQTWLRFISSLASLVSLNEHLYDYQLRGGEKPTEASASYCR